MENNIADNSQAKENLNHQKFDRESPSGNVAVGIDRNKIANVFGIVGGTTFFILNHATKGKVPGGFIGGFIGYLAGYLVGYGIAWLISTVSNKI